MHKYFLCCPCSFGLWEGKEQRDTIRFFEGLYYGVVWKGVNLELFGTVCLRSSVQCMCNARIPPRLCTARGMGGLSLSDYSIMGFILVLVLDNPRPVTPHCSQCARLEAKRRGMFATLACILSVAALIGKMALGVRTGDLQLLIFCIMLEPSPGYSSLGAPLSWLTPSGVPLTEHGLLSSLLSHKMPGQASHLLAPPCTKVQTYCLAATFSPLVTGVGAEPLTARLLHRVPWFELALLPPCSLPKPLDSRAALLLLTHCNAYWVLN